MNANTEFENNNERHYMQYKNNHFKTHGKFDKIGQKLCEASNFQGTCTTCRPYFGVAWEAIDHHLISLYSS